MIIAVDYDNTYAADPETFNKVIKVFQEAGHQVICVTGRPDAMAHPVLNSIGLVVGKGNCIFAGNRWKREAALACGWKVDVWIDDSPEYIAKQYLIGRE